MISILFFKHPSTKVQILGILIVFIVVIFDFFEEIKISPHET